MAFGFERINEFPKNNILSVKVREWAKKKRQEKKEKEDQERNAIWQQPLKSCNINITEEINPAMKKDMAAVRAAKKGKQGGAHPGSTWMNRKQIIQLLRWLDAYKASGEDEKNPLFLEELQKKAIEDLSFKISYNAIKNMAQDCNVHYRYKQVAAKTKKLSQDDINRQFEEYTQTKEFEQAVLRVLTANSVKLR